MELKTAHFLSVLVAVSLAFSGFTAFKMVQLDNQIDTLKSSTAEPAADNRFSLPTGTPSTYGEELDVKYQDVSQDHPKKTEKTIKNFASYDSKELSGTEKKRYIDILHEMNGGISCEYCCEAESVITEDGKPGCGCAHAVAMRGLTKYILKNHGEEMADEEIFQEISKWKTRYFPKQTQSKAGGLQEKDAEVSYVNLASNNYRGVSSDKGGWVGDC